MPSEIIFKKLDQINELLNELEQLLNKPFEEFEKDFVLVRAAERNFQLIVDLASDINTQILVETGEKTPDTYRQSFSDLEKKGVLPKELANKLVVSAKLRNILVHEYDFDEDCEKFYNSAKEGAPNLREYVKIIYSYAKK
jgi:uncharacterized protein YutE (UPF0331/DUF86 family)